MNEETTRKIQEIQILEQNLQNISMQKQSLILEIGEVENALSELESSEDEVYKITGPIMLKSKKEDVVKELNEKRKLIELRTSSIEKQESLISSKVEELRKEVQKVFDKKSKSEKA